MFRIAFGLGNLAAPLLGSVMYALYGFTAVYICVGIGYLVFAPIVYINAVNARKNISALKA